MSRTAHHVPPSHARVAGDRRPGGPWHALVLHDPRRGTRRSVAVYSFPRHNRDRSVARMAAQAERRARQRLRARLGVVVRLVGSRTGALAVDAADAVDIPPARHRHAALWLA
ncbi:hypothetical protein AB4225_32485 [Streptomyces sp. 2RAF24]|uniref:hypothetical protein n=1 Tax=unclassified Streptomyces TaxID=2593676 RepID=UPI003407FDB3